MTRSPGDPQKAPFQTQFNQFEVHWGGLVIGLLAALEVISVLFFDHQHGFLILLLMLPFHLICIWLLVRNSRLLTEYARMQAAYEQEMTFAEQTMEQAVQGVVILNQQTRITYVNPAFAAMLGRVPADLIGHQASEFILPADQNIFVTEVQRRWEGQPHTYTLHLLHRSGAGVAVEVSGHPRWHGGRVVGNFATVRPLNP